jgi:Ca2+/Na+ antiporter
VTSLSTPLLVAVFVAGSAATWIAGIALSKSTDSLGRRFGLGEALGGLILLAIAGRFRRSRSSHRPRLPDTSTRRSEP